MEVLQRIAIGDSENVMRSLGVDSGGKINSTYVERLNLTIHAIWPNSREEVFTSSDP